MTKPAKNAIFLAIDDGYTALARACLNSIRRNFSEHPHIIVSYGGADKDFLSFLRDFRDLEIIPVIDIRSMTGDTDEELKEQLGDAWAEGVEYKYYAWSDRFQDYDSVLYLDADTLVLKPLDKMLSAADFFVVSDPAPGINCRPFKSDRRSDPALLSKLLEDSLPLLNDRCDMCNSGVFVIPKHLRTREHLNQLLRLRSRYRGFCAYPDQSVISMWCQVNKFAYSRSYEFNFQISMLEYEPARCDESDISILHFSGPYKPNSFNFMRVGLIDKAIKVRLTKLFFSYLYDDPAVRRDSFDESAWLTETVLRS